MRKRGHKILNRPRSGEYVTVAMGLVSDVVDSPMCLDAVADGFAGIDTTNTAEDNTGEYAFSVGTGGVEEEDMGERTMGV